jgi:hypothetical protein
VLQSGAHLVEIDLLRGWTRLPPDVLSECDYYVIVSRAEQRPAAQMWPLRLQDRLPEIPIPLHNPDHDAKLDLQQVLNRLYDAAGYEYYIYDTAPHPSLDARQMAWAQQFIPRADRADTLAPP